MSKKWRCHYCKRRVALWQTKLVCCPKCRAQGRDGWAETVVLVEPPKSGWVKIKPQCCDLCHRVAVWKHPAGGFRCKFCPRPE